jgi:formylglycine-generating enzyme required for sulfatase activity
MGMNVVVAVVGALLMECRHLINDGVEETPPPQPLQNGESSQELFTDLKGANVGFNNWHPVAVTGNGNTLAGQSGMGGLWEWTSSPLAEHEGFEPMPLYPAYTGIYLE